MNKFILAATTAALLSTSVAVSADTATLDLHKGVFCTVFWDDSKKVKSEFSYHLDGSSLSIRGNVYSQESEQAAIPDESLHITSIRNYVEGVPKVDLAGTVTADGATAKRTFTFTSDSLSLHLLAKNGEEVKADKIIQTMTCKQK